MLIRFAAVVLLALPSVGADDGQGRTIPGEVEQLFNRLDKLGRGKVAKARFVELIFEQGSESAWLVEEDDAKVVVLRDDLALWTFSKKRATQIPANWHPENVTLKEVRPKDFEQFCRDLAGRKEEEEPGLRMHGPEVSYRVLVSHAAWKKGLTQYCEAILAGEPGYLKDQSAFLKEAADSLAWLQYLRGVNLLMYADRRDVLPQLRLACEIAPDSEHAKAAAELAKQLDRMIRDSGRVPASSPSTRAVAELPEAEQIATYIEQLKDLRCPQMSQPGSITPYLAMEGDEPSERTPTAQLKAMGYAAVPALIKALEDDTPTRTIYHWRDFAHSRLVWRVSDFAWHLLRDMSGREFGNQAVVGFTYSSMSPEEQRAVREEARRWYEETKGRSPDDRLMAAFSSDRFEDWVAAAKKLAQKRNWSPVPLLLKKLDTVKPFQKGELCEVIAKFGDRSAVEPIRAVLKDAEEPSDRIRAAIALWALGDDSGVPLAIQYVSAEKQPYGGWDTPVWFLMRVDTDDAVAALTKAVSTAKAERAGELLGMITGGISGELWSEKREPAGSAKLLPLLVAAMDRNEPTSMQVNNVTVRVKDQAALGFVALRDGAHDTFGGRFVHVDPKIFDLVEPDASKRDAQINALKAWYVANRDHLFWDATRHRLTIKAPESRP